MSFHAKLKEATWSQHEATEQLLFPDRPWQELSLSDYQQFLLTQYVFHSHMEHAIDNSLSVRLKGRLNWDLRHKLPSIQSDLAELASAIPIIPNPTQQIISEAEAIGYLYVTEGSTLGGRMISKALKENEQIATHSSFRFLNVYGEDTGRYWKEFLRVLSEEVVADVEEAVIAAAKRAFGLFTQSVCFVRDKALA